MSCGESFAGGSITFDSGFFGSIKSVRHTGYKRGFSVCEHAGTDGGITKYPHKHYDPGQLIVEIYIPEGSTPPMTEVAETVTVTYPLRSGESTAAKFSGSGFLTEVEENMPFDDGMMGTYTLEFSGNLTYTAAT